MKLYFAPMEGITGLVCRNAYEACFSGTIDKYFAPFITATTTKEMSTKELRDILPEKNEGIPLVPQILANQPESFIRTAQRITSLGYREINLNLGCPSRTVVTKKKGAGFLEFPHKLDAFLQEICEWTEKEDVKFSVKTRLGMQDEDEFWELLEIYNRHPLHELIVHLRTQDDYYVKPVRETMFPEIIEKSKHSLCYNGDLFDEKRIKKFADAYPQQDRVMIGRGLLMHPGMCVGEVQHDWNKEAMISGQSDVDAFGVARDNLWNFHDAVYEGYRNYIQGEKNVLFKMKELWAYMKVNFDEDETVVKKSLKQIRKSQSCADYEMAVRQLRSM
nr:tRNA-dihydrouridine synthase family protein [Lachnospiraceae bacterium]